MKYLNNYINKGLFLKYVYIAFVALAVIPAVKYAYSKYHGIEITRYDHPQKNVMIESIKSIMNKSDGSFIILNAASDTGMFIQYMNDNNRILFDLPDINLSAQQKENANDCFNDQGVSLVNTTGINPITGEKFQILSWQLNLERDKFEEAANIGIKTFLCVYKLSKTERFLITTGN